MTAYLLLTYAALMTLGYLVGLTVGHWTAYADRKRVTHRRQTLAQLHKAGLR